MFKKGVSVVDELLGLAKAERIRTARVEAIGGVDRITLAYYNKKTKRYEEHGYKEFLEVTSMLGNITQMDDDPYVHIHATLGRSDMSVIGGHLIRARVYPFLEVVMTKTENRAERSFDATIGLNAISRITQS